jgi:two-component system phosphate regulon sensor histidine kinase PhoR
MLLEGIGGEVPEEIRPIIEKAYLSNERQINIVNSLLKVAQLDAGRIIIHKTTVDVSEMIQELAEEAEEMVRARQQTLNLARPLPRHLDYNLDVDNMRMAISNLIDNASKYTPEGGIVTLGVKKKAAEVIISVTDTGVGIQPEDIGKLFGKFVRVPNELSHKVGGSGLGLYWVQKVVGLHDGQIEVKSEVGKGTTFSIMLPAQEPDDA